MTHGLTCRLVALALFWSGTASDSALANEQPSRPEPTFARPDFFSSLETPQPNVVHNAPKIITSTTETKVERDSAWAELIAGAELTDGLLPLYRKETKLYAAIRPADFDTDLVVLITIARGIGQRPLVGGYSWGFGDDWICQFRRVGERIHFVRRNVRFRAQAGSPSAEAVRLAYTDSILFSLPIAAHRDDGAVLVDLSPVFLGDLPQIESSLEGFKFSPTKSTWAKVRGFENNIELQIAATYTSDGNTEIESVADTRSVTVNVHYSISRMQQTNYQPRLADDRLGHFLTVVKDFSQSANEDRFVRYINRWHLEKADPNLAISPPKRSIVFWLEKTIPYKYRKPIREGILEWNKAFEAIGFYNAIEVRQQPQDAHWEPGDVRYNTFRWITAGTGVAMGPSRVNPTTGQIMDSDILFDADFLQVWKRRYETFTPQAVASLTGGAVDLQSYRKACACSHCRRRSKHQACHMTRGMSYELALSATVLAGREQGKAAYEKLIMQGLKKVAMHEIGHALGLRHNFKGSSVFSMAETQRRSLEEKPISLSGSVMDYLPVHLAPPGEPQGNYYCTTLGPYDYWAIEYAYRPLSGNSPEEELSQLQKIASRSGEPELAYATDEDTRGIDSDPLSGLFDSGNNPLEFAEKQARLVAASWPDLIQRMTDEGEGYQQARRAFGVLLATHGRAMFAVARCVGGVHTSRSHKGDAECAAPSAVVEADTQRRAVEMLIGQMFSDAPFQFPPELYNRLTVSFWDHWGSEMAERTDFPVHEAILVWQDRLLEKVLSPLTLARLHDSELKIAPQKDAFTAAELIGRLTGGIFSEVAPESKSICAEEYTNRQPAISSLRRNLQRKYLARLSHLAMGKTEAPADCQTIAYAEMLRLEERIERVLESDIRLDAYSHAHLAETASQIGRLLNAQYVQTP